MPLPDSVSSLHGRRRRLAVRRMDRRSLGGTLRCMMMRERHRASWCSLYNRKVVVLQPVAMETFSQQM
ncbi:MULTISPECIES: hypothetical protein [unclassified Bradyrhizobium]|uniref:hypothetical protein n=1 Tax=unclassified Bradyrhizobium TaxID=2631580 RepID=UPI00015199C9|nr:hypothetical protein [Bradyrhizobium sp. BTAi1]ABQ36223.1 hypothetical protein BBta_4162 [Bradyrhizobium sp. BTAi1]